MTVHTPFPMNVLVNVFPPKPRGRRFRFRPASFVGPSFVCNLPASYVLLLAILALLHMFAIALTIAAAMAIKSELRLPSDSVKLGLPLARGAFGTVHWATRNGKRCVAKRAAQKVSNAEAYLECESDINARLHRIAPRSRHLAPFVGVCSIGWMDHLVWEACPGVEHTLAWYLQSPSHRTVLARALDIVSDAPSRLSIAEESALGLKLLQEMLGSLALLHAHGIAHRDVKPSNWLVDGHTHSMRLIDLASARNFTSETTQPTVPTTLAFAPPELHLTAEAPWAFDVYSTALVWLRCCMPASASGMPCFEEIRAALLDWDGHVDLQRVIRDALSAGLEANQHQHEHVWQSLGPMLAPHPMERASACEALHISSTGGAIDDQDLARYGLCSVLSEECCTATAAHEPQ